MVVALGDGPCAFILARIPPRPNEVIGQVEALGLVLAVVFTASWFASGAVIGRVGLALSGGGFRASFLHRFSDLPQTPLEKIESIDMLRALENGFAVRALRWEQETVGVDTPAELARA